MVAALHKLQLLSLDSVRHARVLVLGACIALMSLCAEALAGTASDAVGIVGPNACAECHKQETAAWKDTHHFKTFSKMPRDSEAKKIAKRMGLRRIKSESVCLNCHFTIQDTGQKPKPIAGISCESCHSAGKDWIKVHSGYSGKTAKTESKSEEAARWKRADQKGMIRPRHLYQLAKNCYGCHVVPQEDLVNRGGHLAGSTFELLSWSQGEVRHTTWYSRGKENVPANAARKRMLYLVGLGVELETSLRALAKATKRKPYAFFMARRVNDARMRLERAAKAVPHVPEVSEMVSFGHAAALKLNNETALSDAATGVSQLIAKVTDAYDGSTMANLDPLLPGPNKYKGKARKARAVN